MPLNYRGFGAYVSCDGRELEQFQVKVEGDKVVSCYVPGNDGKEYRVHWIDSKPPTHLSIEVRTDGRRIGVISHTKNAMKSSASGLRVPVDANCSAQFLHVPSGDDALPSAYSEEMGTIELRLRRARDFIVVPVHSKSPAASGPSRQRPNSNAASTKRIPQGQSKETQPKSTVLRPILIDDKPYVIFRFMYRPREVLQANGIIAPDEGHPTASSSSAAKRRKRKRSGVPPLPSTETPSRARTRRRMSDDENSTASIAQEQRHPDDGAAAQAAAGNAQTTNDQENGFDCAEDDMPPYLESEMKRADFPDLPESVPLPDPVVDSDAEEERMVEVHLSAPNGYVLPDWTSAGTVGIKEEPTSVSIKREPSPETITYWSAPSWEAEVKPRLEEEREDPESVIEVHVSSKNQHLVFGHPSRVHAKQDSVKEEETPGPQDVLERHGTPPFKREVEDETIVEVHISSKDIQRAFDTSVDRDSVKAEEVSDA